MHIHTLKKWSNRYGVPKDIIEKLNSREQFKQAPLVQRAESIINDTLSSDVKRETIKFKRALISQMA
ncbi:MAG: hypothetical protein CL889_02810 [Dehalococcoidia bacterium]|nr:hypothetical protein [Dehalococcoidia bacterium]